jgi:hypothetical protein
MSLLARLLAIPVVVAVVIAGVWVTGGVISNDFRVSMALTAVWFAVSGAACVIVALRSRPLRFPVLGAYLVTAALVGGYLGLTTLRDRVVDERVVTAAAPAAVEPASGSAEPRNVQLAVGRFRSHEHETNGTAQVVRLAEGRRTRVVRKRDIELLSEMTGDRDLTRYENFVTGRSCSAPST